MHKQKIITRIGLFRRVLRIFEADVNFLLESGWKAAHVTVEKRGLRIIAVALLEKNAG